MSTLPPSKPKAVVAHYRAEQFIVAPFEILTDPDLTDGDRRMLLALCSFAIGKSLAWPSREALAERAGIDVSNVSKRVRRLVDLGWVTVKQRGQRSNKYFLHLPQRLVAAPGDPNGAPGDAPEPSTHPEAFPAPGQLYDGEWLDASEYEADEDEEWAF